MTKLLQQAFAKAATLPEAAREKLGEEILAHVGKLNQLRAELKTGLDSLERGEGTELEIDDLIRRARSQHVRR